MGPLALTSLTHIYYVLLLTCALLEDLQVLSVANHPAHLNRVRVCEAKLVAQVELRLRLRLRLRLGLRLKG